LNLKLIFKLSKKKIELERNMEFNFECAELLGCSREDGIAIIDASNPPKFVRPGAGGGGGYNAHRSSSNFMGGSSGMTKHSSP